jgi:hypothetical protein
VIAPSLAADSALSLATLRREFLSAYTRKTAAASINTSTITVPESISDISLGTFRRASASHPRCLDLVGTLSRGVYRNRQEENDRTEGVSRSSRNVRPCQRVLAWSRRRADEYQLCSAEPAGSACHGSWRLPWSVAARTLNSAQDPAEAPPGHGFPQIWQLPSAPWRAHLAANKCQKATREYREEWTGAGSWICAPLLYGTGRTKGNERRPVDQTWPAAGPASSVPTQRAVRQEYSLLEFDGDTQRNGPSLRGFVCHYMLFGTVQARSGCGADPRHSSLIGCKPQRPPSHDSRGA